MLLTYIAWTTFLVTWGAITDISHDASLYLFHWLKVTTWKECASAAYELRAVLLLVGHVCHIKCACLGLWSTFKCLRMGEGLYCLEESGSHSRRFQFGWIWTWTHALLFRNVCVNNQAENGGAVLAYNTDFCSLGEMCFTWTMLQIKVEAFIQMTVGSPWKEKRTHTLL